MLTVYCRCKSSCFPCQTTAPARKYKFYREDFADLVTVPLHMDLVFDVTVRSARACNRLSRCRVFPRAAC